MNNIDLKKLAFTGIGYGLVGALFDDRNLVIPLMSSIGVCMSFIDDIKYKVNLMDPAIGIAMGGFIGQCLSNPSENYTSYGFALIGGLMGLCKSYLDNS